MILKTIMVMPLAWLCTFLHLPWIFLFLSSYLFSFFPSFFHSLRLPNCFDIHLPSSPQIHSPLSHPPSFVASLFTHPPWFVPPIYFWMCALPLVRGWLPGSTLLKTVDSCLPTAINCPSPERGGFMSTSPFLAETGLAWAYTGLVMLSKSLSSLHAAALVLRHGHCFTLVIHCLWLS